MSEDWLRILGSSGGFPISGLACSGYLVRMQGRTLLLDCGPGVATALIGADAKTGLDAIIISHLHPDHVLDLVPLGYSLLAEFLTGGRTGPLSLWLPAGGRDFLTRLSDLFGHRYWQPFDITGPEGKRNIAEAMTAGEDWFLTVFEIREYTPGDTIRLAPLDIATAPTDHNIPTAAMRLGSGLVYSADTRFHPALSEFARNAALFLVDAHLSGPLSGGAHMTPAEAGRLAHMARVERLVLCHLGAPQDGPSARQAAAAHYDGPIDIAFETREYRF